MLLGIAMLLTMLISMFTRFSECAEVGGGGGCHMTGRWIPHWDRFMHCEHTIYTHPLNVVLILGWHYANQDGGYVQ